MDLLPLIERFGPWVVILVIVVVTWSRDAGTNDRIVAEFTKTNATTQETLSQIAATMTQQSIVTNERNAALEKLLAQAREEVYNEKLGSLELRATLTDTALNLGHKERELQEAHEANSALRAARDELGTQFATLSADVGTLTSKLEALEAKLSEEQEHSADLGKRLETVETDLVEAKRLREEAERINRELTEERDRLAEDNRVLTRQVELYKAEVQSLREQLTALERRIEGIIDVQDTEVRTRGGAGGGIGGNAAGSDGGMGAG